MEDYCSCRAKLKVLFDFSDACMRISTQILPKTKHLTHTFYARTPEKMLDISIVRNKEPLETFCNWLILYFNRVC